LNITREDMPGRQVALTIELEAEIINSALDRAYRQMVNQVNVPGFRRGKAPRHILESYVGKETLTERAVKNILPQTVQDAIADQNIEAMDVGDVEIVSMDPVQVRVIIVQPPKVELGDYGSIRVEKKPVEVGQEQVEQVLLELRRDGAPWNEPAEPRPIREGDMVYLNLEGFTGAGELEEAKREDFPTIVGMERGGVPMSVSRGLEGMAIGEEKDITDTLPDDYPTEELRGRDVSYHVTTLRMKEQQLPELNDEYAKTLGEYESADALRESVEKNLRERMEREAESAQVDEAISQMVESSSVEVPDSMVKEELDSMLKRLEGRLREQRLSIRQFFTYTGTNEAEWREKNREGAQARVVRTMVLSEFARREGIDVDESEIESEISTMLDRFEGTEKEEAQTILSKHEARHDVEDRLFQRKIVERLVGIAEGRIKAAPAPEGETTDDGRQTTEDEQGDVEDEGGVESDASDLEEAGGAAEVLGTGDVDLRSPNETGEAEGGGTPDSAPGLGGDEK
jgi:trigger factor